MLQIENLVKTVSLSGFLKEKQTVINLHRKLFPRAFEILFFQHQSTNRDHGALALKIKKTNLILISCKINEESVPVNVCF